MCTENHPNRTHGDHDAMPYDGPNADIAHLCQICGRPMPDRPAWANYAENLPAARAAGWEA